MYLSIGPVKHVRDAIPLEEDPSRAKQGKQPPNPPLSKREVQRLSVDCHVVDGIGITTRPSISGQTSTTVPTKCGVSKIQKHQQQQQQQQQQQHQQQQQQ